MVVPIVVPHVTRGEEMEFLYCDRSALKPVSIAMFENFENMEPKKSTIFLFNF